MPLNNQSEANGSSVTPEIVKVLQAEAAELNSFRELGRQILFFACISRTSLETAWTWNCNTELCAHSMFTSLFVIVPLELFQRVFSHQPWCWLFSPWTIKLTAVATLAGCASWPAVLYCYYCCIFWDATSSNNYYLLVAVKHSLAYCLSVSQFPARTTVPLNCSEKLRRSLRFIKNFNDFLHTFSVLSKQINFYLCNINLHCPQFLPVIFPFFCVGRLS